MPDVRQLMAAAPKVYRDHLRIQTGRGPAKLSEVMADFQRQDFAALDGPFMSLARGEAPICGRHWWERTKGSSKDSDAAVMLLWLLAFSPRPITAQVGAADREQANELFRAAKDLLRLNPWLSEAVQVQNFVLLNRRTDSRCEIIASDVAGSHGARPDLLILNELSHITKEDFAKNLLDNASKVGHGLVLICTNAGFVPSWQYDLRQDVIASPRWRHSAYSRPAPWLDEGELQEARKRNSPARYKRLWEGEWVSVSGDAMPSELIDASLTMSGPVVNPEEGFSYFLGLDLSVSKDHSALVLLGRHYTGRLKLCRVISWAPPIDLTRVTQTLFEYQQKWRPRFMMDEYQALHMAQELRQHTGAIVEMVKPNTGPWREMAASLIEAFSTRNIDMFPDQGLLEDLRKLRLVEIAGGCYRLDAPRTIAGHSDRAIALSHAILGARRHPTLAPTLPQHMPVVLTAPKTSVFGDPAAAPHVHGRSQVGAVGYGKELHDFADFLCVGDDIPCIDPQLLRESRYW
jgi:hypothetical protein